MLILLLAVMVLCYAFQALFCKFYSQKCTGDTAVISLIFAVIFGCFIGTATLALGDALAVATLSAKGFTKEDFARSHPGGALGRRLLIHVQDIMRTGEDIPAVREEVGVLEAVREITKKHIGMTAVVDDQGRVTGIFTEGDLRRLIERLGDIRPCVMKDVMIRNPKTIRAQELAASAVKLLDAFHCNQLLVVDEDNRLIGALHLHDLMGAKVL